MVVVRQGTRADVDQAAALWGQAIAGHLGGGRAWRRAQPSRPREAAEGHDPGDHQAELRARLAQPGSFWVVAEDAGGADLVGAAVGLPALEADGAGPGLVPGLVHVTMVCAAPARWGQGIGAAVVDALLAEAVARGFTAAQLWADPRDPRATRLYGGRGFRATGKRKAGPGQEIAHYRMALPRSSPEIR